MFQGVKDQFKDNPGERLSLETRRSLEERWLARQLFDSERRLWIRSHRGEVPNRSPPWLKSGMSAQRLSLPSFTPARARETVGTSKTAPSLALTEKEKRCRQSILPTPSYLRAVKSCVKVDELCKKRKCRRKRLLKDPRRLIWSVREQ